MQTIQTKIIPATNTRPTRVKASCEGGSVTVGYHNSDNPHWKAANQLAIKMGWTGSMIEGCTNNGKVYVFSTEPIRVIGEV